MWKTKSAFRDKCALFKLSLDRDECSDGSHDCDEKAICSNTRGSYVCKCKMGFMGNGKNCEGMSLVIQNYLLFKVSKTTKPKLIKTETASYKMRENVGINLITTTKFLINIFPSFLDLRLCLLNYSCHKHIIPGAGLSWLYIFIWQKN